jgi:hypothetical protein
MLTYTYAVVSLCNLPVTLPSVSIWYPLCELERLTLCVFHSSVRTTSGCLGGDVLCCVFISLTRFFYTLTKMWDLSPWVLRSLQNEG